VKTVFIATFGNNLLRYPRMIGVFSTREKARLATEHDFEESKRRKFAYVSSIDYQIEEYFVDR
jgi:hypothetical protein